MQFKEQLKKNQEQVNIELEKYIRKQECLEKTLNSSMEYSLMAGGKRLRAILIMETYKLFKDDIQKCMPYAVAIEMVHAFSLIHDDLPAIDDDDLRHGKPANHKQYGEATAILAGDSLLNYAYVVISQDLEKSELDEITKKTKVFAEFASAVDRMIAGEYVDTEYEKKQISKEKLEYIHTNKTGALLKACARIGAMLAGCEDKELKRITKYAEKIGLAFQIKDDILSEEGDEKVLGKPVGNDRKMGKCTYVSIYGIEKAKEILSQITNDAIKEIEIYGSKAEFLKELALFIENRNK